MDLDTTKVRELLNKRDEIDAELQSIFQGSGRRPIRCSKCQEEGHTARTCTKE